MRVYALKVAVERLGRRMTLLRWGACTVCLGGTSLHLATVLWASPSFHLFSCGKQYDPSGTSSWRPATLRLCLATLRRKSCRQAVLCEQPVKEQPVRELQPNSRQSIVGRAMKPSCATNPTPAAVQRLQSAMYGAAACRGSMSTRPQGLLGIHSTSLCWCDRFGEAAGAN